MLLQLLLVLLTATVWLTSLTGAKVLHLLLHMVFHVVQHLATDEDAVARVDVGGEIVPVAVSANLDE